MYEKIRKVHGTLFNRIPKCSVRSSSLIISMRCNVTSALPVSSDNHEETSNIYDLEKKGTKTSFLNT